MVAMNQIEAFGRRIGRECGAEKVRERIAMGETFMHEILTQGRILCEATNG